MQTTIYKKFKPILNEDKISLKQQLFLQHYVQNEYAIINRLLLYHGIGTGKTRSSIIIAETIMKNHPEMKAIIILPARLKTNYIDELIPIICEKKYKKELKEYNNINILETRKKELYKIFINFINERYTIHTYEYIVNLFKKSKNINNTLNNLTKNKIIIIDEFHNLISNKISDILLDKLYKKNILNKNSKNIRALIMRYISKYADKTCKMFFLTATPVFDNFNQFVELVKLLNTKTIDNIETLRDLIPYLRGKISYYATINKEYFPKVIIKNLDIPLTINQDNYMFDLITDEKDEDNNEKDTFLIKQRQLSISAYPPNFTNDDKIKLENIQLYAPKIDILIKNINAQKEGKIVVYSNFIEKGLYLIKNILDSQGWSNYINTKPKYKPYKTYIIWDAKLNDTNKQFIKSILNSVDNKDGKIIKLILGSPSIKEGISFKHIQSLHILDPVWNNSAKDQIEGRCIRYKSHEDITKDDEPKLKKEVIIYNYISTSIDKKIKKTCDERIYNEIIPIKQKILNKITKILQDIAIDNYLYKQLSKSPSKSQSININSDENIIIKPNNINKKDYCSNIVAKKLSKVSWFSVMLLSLFYSQYSRQILTKHKPLKPDFFNDLLLKNQPTLKKINEIYKTVYSYINNIIKLNDSIYKLNFLNIPYIYYYNLILRFFNIKSIIINKYNNNNYVTNLNDKNNKNDIPEYIIINLLDNNKKLSNDKLGNKLENSNNFGIFEGLDKLDDVIKYNNKLYKLDSCSIVDYNDKLEHNIAGITCGNKKYIYNSWQNPKTSKNINTELIEYDWDINNNTNFIYNIEKLDKLKLDKKEINISFASGNRTLIYVLYDINYDGDDDYKTKKQNTCPKSRRPINNKCNDGYYIKMNNNNNECCYKLKKNKK